MDSEIYLDYAATAPLSGAARAAYAAADVPGNPHALHRPGRRAHRVLDDAREAIADALGAEVAHVIFTSGGTEADGLAIQGIFASRQLDQPRPSVLVGATEHAAVRENAQLLANRGGVVVEIPVDSNGIISLAFVADHLASAGQETALISVMAANNETGALQPVDGVVELAVAAGVPVHSDWVQAAGKLPLNFAASGLAAASISAHKLGGPGGLGALLARLRLGIAPLIGGGGQERGVRSGTVDARGAAAFAAALTETGGPAPADLEAMLAPLDALVAEHPALRALTPPWAHLPGLRSFSVAEAKGESLVYLLDRESIAVSTGSACTAGVAGPSRVLEAMGLDSAAAASAIRVSVGAASAPEHILALVRALPEAIERAQAASSVRAAPRHARLA
ncbi:MAG: aminotransferase class V-fold PLP-dependent enzyme [Bifidobacteriaceae bacterium]|nr:aminotransferase class V-fold PLP-dependent enzyme [Bifidobacteriaceae bacterium]